MKNKYGIPAFTLPEIAVALLLTALLAVFVYTGLELFGRQAGLVADTGRPLQEMMRLHRALRADTRNSDYMTWQPQRLTFGSEGRTVHYLLAGSLPVRRVDGLPADTFRLHTDSLGGWLLGSRLTDSSLADLVVFYVQLPDGRVSGLRASRQYAAQQLMLLITEEDERH